MTGCDELRDWLIAQGFKVARNNLKQEANQCDWYAYRPSELPARECECNDGKPMQLVVRPWLYEKPEGTQWESVEVDVTGEASGIWYRLQCYSLKPAELMQRLPEIEAALIKAWNALRVSPDAQ